MPIAGVQPGNQDLFPLLQVLTKVTDLAARSRDIDHEPLLRQLGARVRQVLDCDVFALFRTVEGSEPPLLEVQYVTGLETEERHRVLFGQHLVGRAAAEERTIVVNDTSVASEYLSVLDAVRSEMDVPIVVRNQVVGVVDVQSTRLNAFGERERRVLELVASRLALALDNTRLLAELVGQKRMLRMLLELSQEFSTILDLDRLMEAVAVALRRIVRYDSYTLFGLGGETGGEMRLEHLASYRYDQRTPLESVPVDEGVIGAAIKTRRPALVSSTPTHSRHGATRDGIRSEVAIPLQLRDRVVGVLALESELDVFTPQHVEMLQVLASQLAAAIENARLHRQTALDAARLKADLLAARRIQRDVLLPALPDCPGFEIVSYSRPLLVVSGDFYDVYPSSTDSIDILLGDVSGKGAAAALYGALASGLFRSLRRIGQTPAQLLREVNNALTERQRDPTPFAAATYVRWNPESKEVIVSNAGLPYPLVRRGGGPQHLKLAGVPLGMLRDSQYEETSVRLEPGDLLVLASDGVYESEDASGTEFGEAQMLRVVRNHSDRSAREVLDAIVDALERHTAGASVQDDRTLLVVRALPHS